MLCNIVPIVKTNDCSILVNGISHPLINMFGHINIGLLWQIYAHSMVWCGFVISLKFECCFHIFYEHKMWHNIERMFHKIKSPTFCPTTIFWLSLIPLIMRYVRRFECHYLWIYKDPLCCLQAGQKFMPLPLEMSKHIFFLPKDLVFQWPHSLLTHQGLV